MSHIEIIYGFLEIWSIFHGNEEKILVRSKYYYLRKWLRIIKKDIFLQQVWNRANPEERFWYVGNNFFWSIQWNGTNTTENSFAPKMNHLQLNKFFLVFLSFSPEIDKKILFKV